MSKKIISACLCVMSIILYQAGVAAQGIDANPPAGDEVSKEGFAGEKPADNAEAVKAEDEKKKTRMKRVRSSDQIVVTATKTGISKRETGAAVTVITAEEIERSGEHRLSGVLEKTASVTVIRNGSYGGVSFMSIRGAHQKNVLVMIDGVRVNDVSSPDRDFDFGNMSTDNIERVEIIRSGAGILYGSEASGGVINVITKKGDSGDRVVLTAGAGSHYTFRETISASGAEGRGDYSFFIAREDSQGISKAESMNKEKMEKDGYSALNFGSRLGYSFSEKTKLYFGLRYNSSDFATDDGAYSDNPKRTGSNDTMTANLSFLQSSGDIYSYKLTLSNTSTIRSDKDNKPASPEGTWFSGSSDRVDFQNDFKIKKIDVITIGVSADRDAVSSVSNALYMSSALNNKSVYSTAAYAQNHLKIMERYFFVSGVRIDYHEYYGSDVNYSQSASAFIPETGTRFKGNIATGFKAPSIYQLYTPTYGNKELAPEESLTWDAGAEQSFFDDFVVLEGTYFQGEYSNLIGFTTKYANVADKVKTEGIELGTTLNGDGDLSLAINYTWSKSIDSKTGKDLLRRPRHMLNTSVNWNITDKANLNLSGMYRGERKDSYYDSADFSTKEVTMDPYYRVDIAGSYNFYENYSAFGRVQNITNNKYSEVCGYRSDGINIFAGLKAVF